MNEKKYTPKRWAELPIKDKLAYITAIISLVASWVIVVVGLVSPPPGEVHTSVISILGITLMFVASIFGIAFYMKGSKAEVYNDVINKLYDVIDKERNAEKEKI